MPFAIWIINKASCSIVICYTHNKNLGESDLYKLIAIDIDGTLMNDRKEITKEVNDAIQAAKAKGVKVVICTGRQIVGVQSIIEELKLNDEDDFVITFNGALVQNTYSKDVESQITLGYDDLKTYTN
jgi:HAD superfamily hydrolase (TIGR01484 family)